MSQIYDEHGVGNKHDIVIRDKIAVCQIRSEKIIKPVYELNVVCTRTLYDTPSLKQSYPNTNNLLFLNPRSDTPPMYQDAYGNRMRYRCNDKKINL